MRCGIENGTAHAFVNIKSILNAGSVCLEELMIWLPIVTNVHEVAIFVYSDIGFECSFIVSLRLLDGAFDAIDHVYDFDLWLYMLAAAVSEQRHFC